MNILAFTEFYETPSRKQLDHISFKDAIWLADIGFEDIKDYQMMKGPKKTLKDALGIHTSIVGISQADKSDNVQSMVFLDTIKHAYTSPHKLIEQVCQIFLGYIYHGSIFGDNSPKRPTMVLVPLPDYFFGYMLDRYKQLPIMQDPYHFESFRYTFIDSRLAGDADISYRDHLGHSLDLTCYLIRSKTRTPDSQRKLFHRFRVPDGYMLFVKRDAVDVECFRAQQPSIEW